MNASQLLLASLVLLTPMAAVAQSRTNSPAPQSGAKVAAKAAPAPSPAASFEAFKNVPDRNIFNTRRFAGRTSDAPTAPVAPPRRDPVVETFSLLGTLDYPKGPVAFFEGSSSGYRKAVQVDESIGGCKVMAIESALVRLEANGKPVELKVGYMMRREDQGEWKTREAERIFEPTYTPSYSSSSGSSSPFGSSFGGSSSSRDPRDYRSSSGSSSYSRDSRGGSSSFGSSSNPAQMAQQRIREQDRNGDGKISRDEADSRLRDRFRDMDKNSDGQIDAEEYTAYYAARMSGSTSSAPPTSSFNSGSSSASPGTFGGGSPGSSSSPPASTPSSGGGGESDLLKRLMEQRSRENR
jgi:hypothetical protein